jgi:hypothetical protein
MSSKHCVAWTNVFSQNEARESVPGPTLSVFPRDGSAMVAYGPVSRVEDVIALLHDKLRGGDWEWRDEDGALLDRDRAHIPSLETISTMPAVAKFLAQALSASNRCPNRPKRD